MQIKLYAFLSMLLLFTQTIFAAAPTSPTTNLNFSSADGGSIHLAWTIGNGARRIVIARAMSAVTATPVNGIDYLHDEDFGQGQEIAPGQFVVYDGSGNSCDVKSLQPATAYFFTVYEYNGTGSSTEYIVTPATGTASTLSAPTQQSSNIVFSNITGNSMKISWTAGNGSKRLVLLRQGAPVNANPADLVNYNTSTAFGSGSAIGSGNYAIYFGATNNVTVSGLEPSQTYHVAIFDANGTNTPVYYTVAPPTSSAATLPRPTVASSNISFNMIDGTSYRMQWTKGNGSRRIVVARAGSAVDAVPVDGIDYLPGAVNLYPFTTAPEIAPGQKVLYDNIGDVADFTGLLPNTVYHFRVYEYDGSGSTIAYLTSSFAFDSRSTATPPATQSSALQFSNITANSMKLGWTNGDGSKRIVVAKAGAPVDALPVDLVNYSGQSVFGNGTQLGSGNFVVYTGSSNNATVTGLSLNQTYHFAVFEANGLNAPVYNTVAPLAGSSTTTDRPTVASSGIQFSEIEGDGMKLQWTSGNGIKRIIVISENAPVTAVPLDGVDYLTATSSSFTTAPEILPGQKVIYGNSGNNFTVTGLTTGNTYHYRIYEYSGTGTGIAYLTTSFASGSSATAAVPTLAASNLQFTNITGNAMTISWTPGNGARRIVVARAGSAVTGIPVNYAFYSYSSIFGNGAQIGSGNYVIYSGTSNSVTLTNLSLNSNYHFAVYECNGLNNPVYISSAGTGNATTADRPTVAASNLTFSQIDGASMRVGWTNGNGNNRILVVSAGTPVSSVPADGVDYLAGFTSPFLSAPLLANGDKVVYDGNGSFTDITGLQPNTTYHFRVYEYSGSGSSIAYLTSSFATGSKATLSAPTTQAAGLSFTSITSSSMLVSWTNGNGSNRIVLVKAGSAVNASPVSLTDYTSSAVFGNGTQVGSGNYVVAKTNGSSFTITNLSPGTSYHFAVFEYNGSSNPLYLLPGATGQATTIGPPSVQATTAFSSAIASQSLQLNWTNGSGNKRIVLMKQGAPVDALPVNNTSYFGNSFFGSGSQIGAGNYVVFNGIQDFVTVTNLNPGTTYHFAVFEYNDFGATTQYLLTAPAVGSTATFILPVTFTRFTATAAQTVIVLKWETSSEKSSARFDVERSVNGVGYQSIGQLSAAGNSTTTRSYEFTDRQPVDGFVFYRIRETDTDGKSMFSSIIRMEWKAQGRILSLTNPVSDRLSVQFSTDLPKGSQALLADASGRVIYSAVIADNRLNLDMSRQAPGIYFLKLVFGSQVETVRILRK